MSIDPDTPPSATGPGGLMRQAREARGLHITLLATTLRVPPERLKALESENWSQLPDLVFARALAMSVCRQLKIDPLPILAAMPDPDPLRSVRVTAAISAPLGGMASPSDGRQRIWLISALVLLALALWVGWGLLLDRDARPSTSVEVPEMPPVTDNPAPATTPPSDAAPSEVTSGGQSSSTAATVGSGPTSSAGPVPPAALPTGAVNAATPPQVVTPMPPASTPPAQPLAAPSR